MSAAIWSTPEKLMLDYPVASFLQFFDNHRLMHLVRPIWRTVRGGSRSYVSKLAARLGADVRCRGADRDSSADRGREGSDRREGQAPETFDAVILSCHANDSAKMLSGRV